MATVHVLGIPGNLTIDSLDLKLLRAATELAPRGMSLMISEPIDLPRFSDDTELGGLPKRVAQFRERIARHDAFLFASPDSAALAALINALEWASCPPAPPFAWKACAIVGATTSPAGTMPAQWSMRQACLSLNLQVVKAPAVDIPEAHTQFDGEGRLVDESIRDAIGMLLNKLFDLTISITPPERLSSFRHPLP